MWSLDQACICQTPCSQQNEEINKNKSMNTWIIVAYFGVLFLAWILSYVWYGGKWSLLGWFPWTANLLVITLYCLFSFMTIGGGGWAALNVIPFVVAGTPAAIFLTISIVFHPPHNVFNRRTVVASVLLTLCIVFVLLLALFSFGRIFS